MQLLWDAEGVNEVAYWTNPTKVVIASEARQFISPEVPVVRIDPRYFRPTEVENLLGYPSKAKQKLGWEPEITAQQMCSEMVMQDLTEAKRIALLNKHGYQISISFE